MGQKSNVGAAVTLRGVPEVVVLSAPDRPSGSRR